MLSLANYYLFVKLMVQYGMHANAVPPTHVYDCSHNPPSFLACSMLLLGLDAALMDGARPSQCDDNEGTLEREVVWLRSSVDVPTIKQAGTLMGLGHR